MRLSENQIEVIPESFAEGDLGKSLEHLWMDRNKLLKLSESFGEFACLETCKFDLNPMRSPPPDVFRFGVPRLIEYCNIRNEHIMYLNMNLPNALKKIVSFNI